MTERRPLTVGPARMALAATAMAALSCLPQQAMTQEVPAPAAPAIGQPAASLTPPALVGTMQDESPRAPSAEAPNAEAASVQPNAPLSGDGAGAAGAVVAPAPSAQQAPAPSAQQNPAPLEMPPAQTPAIQAAPPLAPTPALPHELSPWGMFLAADWVVKGVMIGLALAAFLTWTVLVFKLVEMAQARGRLGQAARVIRHADSLGLAAQSLSGRRDPAAFMVLAAAEEQRLSADMVALAGREGLKERIRSILERTEVQAGRRLMRGTGLLATIGSVAPFVGLFGTVWGIMNSFIGISKAQTTNLAVVAPGIAEALLATAIGLVAAIPAVVIYNHFARAITGYRQALGDASAGVERLLSRDLDRQAAAAAQGGPGASAALGLRRGA